MTSWLNQCSDVGFTKSAWNDPKTRLGFACNTSQGVLAVVSKENLLRIFKVDTGSQLKMSESQTKAGNRKVSKVIVCHALTCNICHISHVIL